jgi:general secretion pathway protein D
MKKMTWIVVALVSLSINLASAQSADVAEMIREAERVLGEVQVEENAVEGTAEQAAPAAAPVVAPVVAAVSLIDQGVDFYDQGDYERAEKAFEAVLVEDPYNRKAMAYLKKTALKVAAANKEEQRTSRARAIAEVEKAWNPEPSLKGNDLALEAVPEKTEEELAIEAMTERVKAMNIPTLDFVNAPVQDVVIFLSETCRRQDGKGINILTLGMSGAMDVGGITISIRDLNLYEALEYITEIGGLKFEVQPKAVAIMPVNYVAPRDLVLKSYDIIPEVGSELESISGGDSMDDLFGDSVSSTAGPTDVAAFFSIVSWPEGSSAVYQPNFSKLFVKNTEKNLAEVEQILNELKDEAIERRSQQVEIEAKFVEYNEGALEELGFDWTLYAQDGEGDGEFADFTIVSDGDGNTPADGVSLYGGGLRDNTTAFSSFTDAYRQGSSSLLDLLGGTPATLIFNNDNDIPLDLAISAMEQEGTADVLSAPKVTTKSGNEAVIRVSERHRYPQDYNVETGQRTAPVVVPQDWEDYDLGVVLNVTPVVDSESNTIDLDLRPEITKLLGYDRYQVAYNSYDSGTTDRVVISGDGSELVARMPFFEHRTIETQVTISDGSTVVMGGLVDERTETFSDQVPLFGDLPYVGRFFRSEGTRNQKKNLIITVKATQVDDRGLTRSDRIIEREREAL